MGFFTLGLLQSSWITKILLAEWATHSPGTKEGAMDEMLPMQAFSDATSGVNLIRHFWVQYGLLHHHLFIMQIH